MKPFEKYFLTITIVTSLIAGAWGLYKHSNNTKPSVVQTIEGNGSTQINGSNFTVNLPPKPKKPTEVSAQISVSTENRVCDDFDKDFFECGENQKKLEYWIKESDESIEIYPEFKKVLQPIEMLNGENIGLRYPKLDFKILNNTDDTFFISAIELSNVNSKLDNNVYFNISMPCSNKYLDVSNHNRFSYEDMNRLNNLVLKSNPKIEYVVEYNGRKSLKKTMEIANNTNLVSNASFEVNIVDSLLEVGVNINKIEEINEQNNYILGELTSLKRDCSYSHEGMENTCSNVQKNILFSKASNAISELAKIDIITNPQNLYLDKFNYPVVKGYLTYEIYSYEKKKIETLKIPFSEQVFIFETFECGDMLPPSETYTTKLKTTGQNYQLLIPVSQSIKPGEADRFELILGVDEASFHKFTPTLKTVDGKDKQLKNIEIYIP